MVRVGSEGSLEKKKKKRRKRKLMGYCDKIFDKLRLLWRTRMTEDIEEGDIEYVRITIRELIIYSIFMVFVSIASIGMTDHSMTHIAQQMKEIFFNSEINDTGTIFKGIASMDDVWGYLEGPLVDALYWDNIQLAGRHGYVAYENRLLGVARLRQLRAIKKKCIAEDHVISTKIQDCYTTYNSKTEDTKAFIKPENSTLAAWEHRSADELNGNSHMGIISKYEGGGFVQNLALNRSGTVAILSELKENLWIDRGTRAVFVDLAMYNPNNNIFITVRMLVEFPHSGGVLPSCSIRTAKLIRYLTTFDYFVLACEVIFGLFIVYYIVEEAIEIKKHGLKYILSFGGILDLLIIAIAVCDMGFNLYSQVEVQDKLDTLFVNPADYADFAHLTYWQVVFNNASAAMVFMAWIKIFSFLSFNKILVELSTTLSRCAWDLLSFLFMFLIMFITFAQAGYIIFGKKLESFQSLGQSFFTLFRIILGDINFYELESANRILGPPYFIIFIVIVFFGLLNMFLAIINETYNEVKDGTVKVTKYSIVDYVKEGYEAMVERITRAKHEEIHALMNRSCKNIDKLDFDEWRANLKKRGYAPYEIDVAIENYGKEEVKKEEAKPESEQEDVSKLERERSMVSPSVVSVRAQSRADSKSVTGSMQSLKDTPDEELSLYELYDKLDQRVSRIEECVVGVAYKIDAVLARFEEMENERLRKLKMLIATLDNIKLNDTDIDPGKRDEFEKLLLEELDIWNGFV